MTLPTTEPIPIESGVMATTAPPAASKRRGRPPKTSKVPATAETTEHQEEEVLDEGHAPAAPSPALGSLEEQDEQQAEQQPEQQLHLDSAALLVEESGDSAAAWLQTSATQTLDLAAHSVLCYELLGGEGVERVPEETDSAMCARLWAEWEETPGHDTPLLDPESPPNFPPGPTLRLKIVRVLSLLKQVAKETDESAMDEAQTYATRKAVAVAYEELLRLLTATSFAEEKFINSSTFISILVELKSQFIVAEMYAGLKEGSSTYRNYRKGEGKALIKSVFDTAALLDLPETLLPKVKAVFEQREGAIIQLLNQGRMTFDEYPLPDLETQLRVFMSRIFKDLNDKRLPDMHPDYQEVSVSRTPRSGLDADSLTNQLHRDQMAQLLNAVEMVTQRSQTAAQAVMKNMHDASSRYGTQVYTGLPEIVDEFDSPFDSMSAAMTGSPVLSAGLNHGHLHLAPPAPGQSRQTRPRMDDEENAYPHHDPTYDPENWHKRPRTEMDNVYQPPSNLHIVLDPKNPLSPFQSGRTTPRRRPPGTKVPWTQDETDALEQGMNIFGNDWKAIKDHFRDVLSRRSNVNLKDRARNIKRKLGKSGLPLGIWANACN